MWTAEHLEEDIQMILKSDLSNLNIHKYQQPSEGYLNYRFTYVKILYYLRTNDIKAIKQLTVSEISKVLLFFREYNYDGCLQRENSEPPFDLLVMIIVDIDVSNNSFFIKLLQHYINVMREIEKQKDGDAVFLNDQVRRSDFIVQKEKAKEIVQNRIDYIIELILSKFYDSNNIDFFISFFRDFKLDKLAKSEETLSFIGRIALSLGFDNANELFFSKVTNENLKRENEGIKYFFENNFPEAEKCAKPNSEDENVYMYYQGKKLNEYLSKNKIE